MRDTERGRKRERQRHRQREKQLHAPGAWRGIRSRVSRIAPWAKGRRQTAAPTRDPSPMTFENKHVLISPIRMSDREDLCSRYMPWPLVSLGFWFYQMTLLFPMLTWFNLPSSSEALEIAPAYLSLLFWRTHGFSLRILTERTYRAVSLKQAIRGLFSTEQGSIHHPCPWLKWLGDGHWGGHLIWWDEHWVLYSMLANRTPRKKYTDFKKLQRDFKIPKRNCTHFALSWHDFGRSVASPKEKNLMGGWSQC